jgi:TIGR03009 family protein
MSAKLLRVAAFVCTLGPSALALAQYGPADGAAGPAGPPRQSQVTPVNEAERESAGRNPISRQQPQAPNASTPTAAAGRPVGAAMPGEPVIPCPFSALAPEQQQHLDQMLTAWEQHSSKIERYRCEFERWEYDPVFGPNDPKQAKTYANGKLRYAAPDKGLFKVESVKVYTPPAMPGGPPQWLEKKENLGEHWVCDGKRIFEFDATKRQLIERTLPPEMHGKAIVDGPLPFLFGAKVEKIKARYWLRVITPPDVTGEYWLEAAPKYRADAQNFKMVHVIIDEQDFLPKAIQMFDPAYDPQKRPIRTVFTFNKREVNWSLALQNLKFWEAEFYAPRAPLGWKKVVEPFMPEPGQPQVQQPKPAQAGSAPPTAQRVANPLKLPFTKR